MEIQLDIDRLHDVIDGAKIVTRGAGRTTATLIQALQSADVFQSQEPGVFVVVTMSDMYSDMLLRYSRDLLPALGINDATIRLDSRSIVFSQGNEVRFIPAWDIPRRLRGVRIVNYYLDNTVPCLKLDELDFIEERIERE